VQVITKKKGGGELAKRAEEGYM